jgi:hypothetical protein
MARSDHSRSEVADIWLTFVAVFLLAAVAMTVLLSAYVSFYWAVAGAVAIAIGVGWAISLIRPLRRLISDIVQFFLEFI